MDYNGLNNTNDSSQSNDDLKLLLLAYFTRQDDIDDEIKTANIKNIDKILEQIRNGDISNLIKINNALDGGVEFDSEVEELLKPYMYNSSDLEPLNECDCSQDIIEDGYTHKITPSNTIVAKSMFDYLLGNSIEFTVDSSNSIYVELSDNIQNILIRLQALETLYGASEIMENSSAGSTSSGSIASVNTNLFKKDDDKSSKYPYNEDTIIKRQMNESINHILYLSGMSKTKPIIQENMNDYDHIDDIVNTNDISYVDAPIIKPEVDHINSIEECYNILLNGLNDMSLSDLTMLSGKIRSLNSEIKKRIMNAYTELNEHKKV